MLFAFYFYIEWCCLVNRFIVLSRGSWCWAMVDINSIGYCDLCTDDCTNELTDDPEDLTTPEVSLEGSNCQGSQETSGEFLTQSQEVC